MAGAVLADGSRNAETKEWKARAGADTGEAAAMKAAEGAWPEEAAASSVMAG